MCFSMNHIPISKKAKGGIMKITIIAIMVALLAACATRSYTVGKPFPSEKVELIKKGETTASEIEAMFGQPFSKSATSATQEKWIYSYVQGTASATMGAVSSTSNQKTLDLLMDDGIVINYTFMEGAIPGYESQ